MADFVAVKINAGNDTNGKPRRGWIVLNNHGATVDFVDEGYQGIAGLRSRYPAAVEGPEISTKAGEYREWLRFAATNK